MSDDQQRPASGVTVTASWEGNPKPVQALTASNGTYKLQIPDGLPGPITINYSKTGFVIFIANPPPLANTSSQKLPPIFVQLDTVKVSDFADYKTLAKILKARVEAVQKESQAIQFKEDIRALQDAGVKKVVVDKVETKVRDSKYIEPASR